MDWFVEVMSGEVNWYELVIFLPIYNLILRRYLKGPKGDKGAMGPMGMMGRDGKDGNSYPDLDPAFKRLTETEAYKEWKKKHNR